MANMNRKKCFPSFSSFLHPVLYSSLLHSSNLSPSRPFPLPPLNTHILRSAKIRQKIRKYDIFIIYNIKTIHHIPLIGICKYKYHHQ